MILGSGNGTVDHFIAQVFPAINLDKHQRGVRRAAGKVNFMRDVIRALNLSDEFPGFVKMPASYHRHKRFRFSFRDRPFLTKSHIVAGVLAEWVKRDNIVAHYCRYKENKQGLDKAV